MFTNQNYLLLFSILFMLFYFQDAVFCPLHLKQYDLLSDACLPQAGN